jgi:cyanate permease
MSVAANTKEAVGRSAMNKAFWRILPLIGMAYIFAFMDRVNVGFAAAQMNEDLKFSATVYGFGGGLFFLAYALFAIPSNLMLVRFGAAAINMLSQFGAFLGPYGWGIAKDATGSFQAALTAFSVIALLMAGLLLLVRQQARGRIIRSTTVAA